MLKHSWALLARLGPQPLVGSHIPHVNPGLLRGLFTILAAHLACLHQELLFNAVTASFLLPLDKSLQCVTLMLICDLFSALSHVYL